MTTPDTMDLSQAAGNLREAAERALRDESADGLELLERQISDLDALVRELQQTFWSNEAKSAIRRLESGKPLSDEDQAAIRAFLVSDAEHYLAQENSFEDWIAELHRLIGEIGRRTQMVDRETVADLRGVLKDAVRLVPDIRNYLDERRRVELFNQALTSLDEDSRQTLARLLKEQLESSRV